MISATFHAKFELADTTAFISPRDCSPTYKPMTEKLFSVEYDDAHCVITREGLKLTGERSQQERGLQRKNRKVRAEYYTDDIAGGVFVIYSDGTAELTTFGFGRPIIRSIVGELN